MRIPEHFNIWTILWQAHEFQLNDSLIGIVTATSFAADLCVFPFAGIIIDKFGRKWAGGPALFVMAIGMLFLAVSSGVAVLVLGGLLLGIGNGLSVS